MIRRARRSVLLVDGSSRSPGALGGGEVRRRDDRPRRRRGARRTRPDSSAPASTREASEPARPLRRSLRAGARQVDGPLRLDKSIVCALLFICGRLGSNRRRNRTRNCQGRGTGHPDARAARGIEVLRRRARLRDVSIALRAGEVRALAGRTAPASRRSSGCSPACTRPDAGSVLVDGEPVAFHGPADARDAGVAVIYQEPTLFPDLSVAENVMMGRQPLGAPAAGSTARRCTARSQELLDRLGVKLDPEQPVARPVHRRPADRRDRQGALASTRAS